MPKLTESFFSTFRFGTTTKAPYEGVKVHVALIETKGNSGLENLLEIYFDAPVFWGCCPEGDEDYLVPLNSETKTFLESLNIEWVGTGNATTEFARKHFPNTWAAEGITKASEIPTRKGLFGRRKRVSLAEYRKKKVTN